MGHTIVEKIIMKNTGLPSVRPGDIVIVKPSYAVVHDIYTDMLSQKLKEMGFLEVWDKDRAVVMHDHLNPACMEGDPRNLEIGYQLVEDYGLTHFHPNGGIVHQLIPELGYARPGEIIFVTDSHTPTYGAIGCFSTGIGYTEMAYVWGKGELWLRVPSAIKIQIDGRLPEHVYAKDIILRVLGDLRAAGGTYKSLEFSGTAIDELTIDGRLTIANMVVECGGKAGMFATDEKTAAYCNLPYEEIAWVRADEDAEYEQTLYYKAEQLEPVLSCPPYVDNVKPLSEVEETKINQVCFGSCTNGRLEDLKIAADIVRGKKIAKYLKFVVTPASNNIMEEAMKLGYIQDLVRAGAMVTPPYCSFCEGRTMALMGDGEIMLGTNNRNFLGRYGSPKAEVYLSSPAVAAASAITGYITNPGNKWNSGDCC